MKKISSKIIIFVILVAILFGGVSFGVEKNSINISWGINKVFALNGTEFCNGAADQAACAQEYQNRLVVNGDDASAANISQPWDGVTVTKSGVFSQAWRKLLGFGLTVADYAGGVINGATYTVLFALLYSFNIVVALFVALMAIIFHLVMIISIENFAEVVKYSGVQVAWKIFRNLINISFIFTLLYIAISTIIGKAGVKTKSTLANVIIAALLINFSLFFTRVMIDASNILTVALYNYVGGPFGAFGKTLMNGLSLQSAWQASLSGQISSLGIMSLKLIITSLLLYTYYKAAFIFMGRMVMFLILMSLSPVAFLGDAIPGLSSFTSKWWVAFSGQLFVAPAFVFLMIIIVTFLSKGKEITALSKGVGTIAGYTTNFEVGPLIFYGIVMTLLLGGMKQVVKLSGEVGELAEKILKAVVAAVVIAVGIAVTGGASLAAGSGIKGALGAIGSKAKSFATGEMGKEPGLLGAGARLTRNTLFQSTKDMSGGKVDLFKASEMGSKYQKSNEERIMKQLEEVGPQKAEKELKVLEKINQNIDRQTNPKLKTEATEAEEKVKDLEAKIAAEDKKIADAKKEESAAVSTELKEVANRKIRDAEAVKAGLTPEYMAAGLDKAVKADALKAERERIAAEMGTSTTDLESRKAAAEGKREAGVKAQSAYAKKIEEGGFFSTGVTMGMTAKERKKMADQVRAQKGEFKDFKKQMEKLFKDEGILKEEPESKPKPETPKP